MSVTDLVPVETRSGVETYRASTDAATLCGEIVKATATKIQGKRYVTVEGWQAIAIAHGCVASSRDVEVVDGGIRAIGEIRRMSDGGVIATAEGFLGDDEQMWAKRPMFARRAMAQTRAISRACRSAFAHVVILIDRDLGTTPAEEMQGAYDHDPDSFKRPAGSMSSPKDFAGEAKRDGLTTGDDRSTYEVDKAKKVALLKDTALLAIGTSINRSQLKAWWEEHRDEMKKKLSDDEYVEVYDAVQARRDVLPAIAA